MAERSLEELFAELKKLPDWDRYPYPEVFYKHFNVQKPKPAELSEVLTYRAPPSLSTEGETRIPEDANLRPVSYQGLPVQVSIPNPDPPKYNEFKLSYEKLKFLTQRVDEQYNYPKKSTTQNDS